MTSLLTGLALCCPLARSPLPSTVPTALSFYLFLFFARSGVHAHTRTQARSRARARTRRRAHSYRPTRGMGSRACTHRCTFTRPRIEHRPRSLPEFNDPSARPSLVPPHRRKTDPLSRVFLRLKRARLYLSHDFSRRFRSPFSFHWDVCSPCCSRGKLRKECRSDWSAFSFSRFRYSAARRYACTRVIGSITHRKTRLSQLVSWTMCTLETARWKGRKFNDSANFNVLKHAARNKNLEVSRVSYSLEDVSKQPLITHYRNACVTVLSSYTLKHSHSNQPLHNTK